MDIAPTDGLYKDIHATMHLAPDGAGGYRLSSAVFRQGRRHRGPDGKWWWESSADAESLAGGMVGERGLRAGRMRSDWGTGRVAHADVAGQSGSVEHSPEGGNDAHCALFVPEGRAKRLAKLGTIEEYPKGL